MKWRIVLPVVLAILAATSCNRAPQPARAPANQTLAIPGRGSLPDRALTPGATLDVTKDDVCVPGYSSKVRHVPVSVKRQVFLLYKTRYVPHAYEVDHLISLELGGSNSVKNLWPEPYSIVWNAHVKDALENRLHRLVCDGTVTLRQARQQIRTDWIGAYKYYYHSSVPLSLRAKASSRQEFRETNDDESETDGRN